MKLSYINSKKVVKAFEKMGYKIKSQRGTHVKLVNEETDKVVIIPIHHKEISIGTITDILNNQANI